MSLGAPYQGSKGQIATRVVDALPSGRRFVDLFSDGVTVTHAAMLSGKYGEYRMNDINPAGLELFLGGMRGDYHGYRPRELSAEEFKAIKGTPEGLMLSYGGLDRNVDPDKDSVARRVQRLEDLKGYADQVKSSNSDYRDVELEPGDVVVTQDMGLASMVLGRGAKAIGVRGETYDKRTIDALLLVRHAEKEARRNPRRGTSPKGGPRAFTSADRRHFVARLREVLEEACAD